MNTYGELKNLIQDMLDDHSDETAVIILRVANMAHKEICAMRPWTLCTKQITVNLTTGILPADFVKPVYAEDDTDYMYFQSDIKARYWNNRLYNYFMNLSVTSPLYSGSDLVTTINSTTVTSATANWGTDVIGEWIRIGAEGGVYKIAARPAVTQLTLETAFKWASFTDPSAPANLTAQYYEIRPNGTRKILATDEKGDAISSSTLKLWYLAEPPKLYNDYDQILLPSIEAMTIKIARHFDNIDRYTNDNLKKVGDYEAALARMKSLDPMPLGVPKPVDRFGDRIMFGRKRGGGMRLDSNDRLIIR